MIAIILSIFLVSTIVGLQILLMLIAAKEIRHDVFNGDL